MKKCLIGCAAAAAAWVSCAQELNKANNTTALNLAGSWVENLAPSPADTLVWGAAVATAANSNATLGAGLEVAGLRVESPAADVRISGASLVLTNGQQGISVSGSRNLYVDTPVATLPGASQSWTVGAGRQLGFGRAVSLGAGSVALTGAGSIAFAEKLEDLAGRAAPLEVTWSGPTGTFATAAARKNLILTDRGSTNVTVAFESGALMVSAANDNYGFAIGMKRKETWTLSGGTVTVDAGSAFHVGGAGNYAAATGEGVLNLTGAGRLVALGTLPLYVARPGTGAVGTRGTITLSGGTLETARTFQKVAGTGGNTAAFHFDGGLLRATAGNADWFQNLDALDVQEGGAAIEVVAGAQALIRQPLVHGGAAGADGGLVKTGAGTLGVSNAFTGPVTVSAGVLGLESVPGGSLTVAPGAGLAFKDPADLVAALGDTSGKVALDADAAVGLYVLTNAVNTSLAGVSLGTRRFVKMGSGALTLTSAAVLAAATNGVSVIGAPLNYQVANAVPAGVPISVSSGGQLVLNYGASMALSNPLTLAGNYDTGDGNGSLYVSWNGGAAAFNAPVTLAGDTKIKTFSTSSAVTFNQPISGTGNLVVGAGGAASTHVHTFTFNAANTFAGDVTLKNDAGANARFVWGVDNAMPASGALLLGGPSWNNTYAMVDLRGFAQTSKGVADGAVTGAIRLLTNSLASASVLTLTDTANRAYSGALGGRIDIVKTGAGDQALTGSGLGHTGTVALLAGSLTVGPASLPNADVTVSSGASLRQSADGATTVARTTITGNGLAADSRGAIYLGGGNDTWNGEVALAGTARIGAYGGGTITKTFAGPLTGSGALSIWAGGGGNTHVNVYVLSGASTFSGSLLLEASYGANMIVKLSGSSDRLPDGVPVTFSPSWDSGANRAYCLLDLTGTDQRAGGLVSGGHADHCRAVVNSSAGTTGTLTLNTVGGTATFEGTVGASGPCASAGAIRIVKRGAGAQLFKKGPLWYWNDARPGTNFIHADIVVEAGAVGFSGVDMLGPTNNLTVAAGGALIATNKAVLAALMADPRVSLDPAAAVGLYDLWDVTAAGPGRLFYYSGNASPSADNTAALPNGVAFAGGVINISRDGALGDAVFGPLAAPVYLNGTTLKNNNNNPVLASGRTITINAGGAAFTAGWSATLAILSALTGTGGLNINCDSGWVLLGNGANDYAGDTTVATLWAGAYGSAARLRLAASEVIPHGAGKGSLVLNAGATVDLNGFSETVNGLWSSAPGALVTNAAATLSVLTVGAADASSSYAGSTGGALSLVKTGGGVLTLSGVCGHSGPTVAAAGTLSLAAACVMTNSAVEVRGGATLALADGDALGGTNTTAELFADAAARLSIPAGVEVSVFHFSLGGQFKKAGTWGASGSGADFINDDLFEAGGGILRVLATGPQRGTVLSLR